MSGWNGPWPGKQCRSHFVAAMCVRVSMGLTALFLLAHLAHPASQMTTAGQIRVGRAAPLDDSPMNDPVFRARRIRALNQQRQKDLVTDTRKLLLLSTQLNEEIDKQDAPTLTPVQLRHLAQIEKLAHSVREKMSDAAGEPGPELQRPPMRPYPE